MTGKSAHVLTDRIIVRLTNKLYRSCA